MIEIFLSEEQKKSKQTKEKENKRKEKEKQWTDRVYGKEERRKKFFSKCRRFTIIL